MMLKDYRPRSLAGIYEIQYMVNQRAPNTITNLRVETPESKPVLYYTVWDQKTNELIDYKLSMFTNIANGIKEFRLYKRNTKWARFFKKWIKVDSRSGSLFDWTYSNISGMFLLSMPSARNMYWFWCEDVDDSEFYQVDGLAKAEIVLQRILSTEELNCSMNVKLDSNNRTYLFIGKGDMFEAQYDVLRGEHPNKHCIKAEMFYDNNGYLRNVNNVTLYYEGGADTIRIWSDSLVKAITLYVKSKQFEVIPYSH